MKNGIKNVNIVTPEGVIKNGFLVYEDGIITYVGQQEQEVSSLIDGKGGYLFPGFIDLHCHGGMGADFMDATEEEMDVIANGHAAHGTTTMLATILTASPQETRQALDTFAAYQANHPDSRYAGVHIEGPWFNPLQCGAQDTNNMKKPDPEELKELKERYPFILRISAAPELEQGDVVGKVGTELGILMSAGHTDANFHEIEQAYENGYILMTHLYSGMKGVTRKNAFRIAGAVEGALYLDDMYVELITDGRHLPAELLSFVYKIKGPDKICLITDAIRAGGMPNGTESILGSRQNGTPVIVEDEVAKLLSREAFAGSGATYDRVFRTMAEATGASAVDMMKMSAQVPAKLLGLSDRGEIAVGKRADLVLMDSEYQIQKVIY